MRIGFDEVQISHVHHPILSIMGSNSGYPYSWECKRYTRVRV